MIVQCQNCGTLNRTRDSAEGQPVCGKCKQALPKKSDVMAVDEHAFDAILAGVDRPVLVDFWATWCNPCRMLAPILHEFSLRYPHIQVLKVDIDRNPSLSERFQIAMVPTLILFERGQVLKRMSGAITRSELEGHFQEWLKE